MPDLRSPFPWFGGKSRAAHLIWAALGDCPNYVEPFFGSGAVLLGRPHAPGIETVNDIDGMVSNFWRAVADHPKGVAHHADWPVSEVDLHARHLWLVERLADGFAEWLMGDSYHFDVKVAGWWVWGMASWIGGEFCSGKGPWGRGEDGRLVRQEGIGINRKLPHLSAAGQGIQRKLPHLGNAGRGVSRSLPHLSRAGQGIKRAGEIAAYLEGLAARLRSVRVCCGDWTRVMGPSVTSNAGTPCGIVLDPPYQHAERDIVYTHDHDVAADVMAWALEHGADPALRIVVCGYEGDCNATLAVHHGWSMVPWKAVGGYGNRNDDGSQGHRERLWLSPHCLAVEPAQMSMAFA